MRWMMVALLALGATAQAGKKKNKKQPAPVSEAVPAAAPSPVAVEPAAAPTGPSPDAILLPCAWETGVSFEYAYSSTRQKGAQVNPMTTTTPITLTFGEGGNPSKVTYAPGESTFEGPEEMVAQAKQMVELLGADAVPALELSLADGAITGLVNHADIAATTRRAVESIMPPGTPPQIKEQALAMATQEQTLLAEPARFFAMHCMALAPNQAISGDATMMHPVLGAPVTQRSEIRLAQVTDETLTFETKDSIPPEVMDQLSQAVLAQVSGGMTLNEEQLAMAMAQLPPLDVLTTGTMVYARADGFPVSVSITMTAGSEDHPAFTKKTWTWTRK